MRGRHQRLGRRQLLLRNGVLLGQLFIAGQVDLLVGERGLVARQHGFDLHKRRLQGARIDLGQHVTGPDHLAFGEIDLHQHARRLRPHHGGGQRRDGTQRIDADIDRAAHRGGDANRLRRVHAAAGTAATRTAARAGGAEAHAGIGGQIIDAAKDDPDNEGKDHDLLDVVGAPAPHLAQVA